MNASHSWLVIFKCACESAIDLPVYFCGPPAAQQTISVTRYLNPAGGTRWCASSTRGLAFNLGSTINRSSRSSTTVRVYRRHQACRKEGALTLDAFAVFR